MASLRQAQAGRDAASFDDDRKEGRYPPGYFNVGPAVGPDLSDADWEAKQAVIAAAISQCESAFGKYDRKTGRYVSAHSVARAA